MPTVLRVGPYRLFFYSGDGGEPPHIHVERNEYVAKVWLDPARLARSGGFRAADLRDVTHLVAEHRERLLEAWYDHFGR